MKILRSLLLVTGLWTGLAAEAGVIRGQVRVTGTPSPPPTIGENSRKETTATPKTNAVVYRDFVVYLEGATRTNYAPPFAPVTVQVRRNAKEVVAFSPHILPVLVGTSVAWRNDDSVYHKFFSLSDVATFEFPLCQPGETSPRWKFEKPGRADVFCSIYANLSSIVLVLENPWFTGTDYRNNYLIRNVPAGVYQLKVWHERLPLQTREILVPTIGEVKIDFTLDLGNLPAN